MDDLTLLKDTIVKELNETTQPSDLLQMMRIILDWFQLPMSTVCKSANIALYNYFKYYTKYVSISNNKHVFSQHIIKNYVLNLLRSTLILIKNA